MLSLVYKALNLIELLLDCLRLQTAVFIWLSFMALVQNAQTFISKL